MLINLFFDIFKVLNTSFKTKFRYLLANVPGTLFSIFLKLYYAYVCVFY
jgi:hypothetical protein